ncbi:MAG: hypothetical protein KME46_12315 [Brasilonema angustatum HA4187-MV1]|nr:hypothetical protein [Brasilonema angustatum HA4187-MV1]
MLGKGFSLSRQLALGLGSPLGRTRRAFTSPDAVPSFEEAALSGRSLRAPDSGRSLKGQARGIR